MQLCIQYQYCTLVSSLPLDNCKQKWISLVELIGTDCISIRFCHHLSESIVLWWYGGLCFGWVGKLGCYSFLCMLVNSLSISFVPPQRINILHLSKELFVYIILNLLGYLYKLDWLLLVCAHTWYNYMVSGT